jgi:hypothetical protein
MRPSSLALAVCLGGLFPLGCGDGTPTVVPTPTPTPVPTPTATPDTGVVVGPHTGPTEITFVSANPPPGSTIAGCGSKASGCSGRVRMRFRLLSASGGPVLNAIGFLHATNQLACYRGSTDRLDLAPGVPYEIEIVFDEADDTCGMPATIATMKVVLNAPGQTDGLQEWGIRYELRP